MEIAKYRLRRVLLASALVLLPACGSGTTNTDGSASGNGGDSGSEVSWQDVSITDVDGEQFTLNDLIGKPVFVENFATWCGQCRKQLPKTERAAVDAGDSAVFLALSVETDLDPAKVADYAESNGFDNIRFAVMTPKMAAAIQRAFGTTALNAPSTPKIIIDAQGNAGDMTTGFEETDEILKALRGG